MKKLLKIIIMIPVVLIILLSTAFLLIQTRPFKNWLAQFAEKTVSRTLNAQLSIGRIDGNFFSNLRLTDVCLISQADTLAFLPEVSFSYSLLPLLHKQIQVNSILINSPRFHMTQLPDSSWIFSRLVKPPDSLKAKASFAVQAPDSTHASFPLNLTISKISIRNGQAAITAFSPLIPKQVREIKIELAGSIKKNQFAIDMQTLRLQCDDPDWTVKNLTFSLQKDTVGLTLRNFALRTGRNAVDLAAAMSLPTLSEGTAHLETGPVDWREFAFLLPTLTVPGNPTLLCSAAVKNGELSADLSLADDKSSLRIQGRLEPFSALLQDSLQAPPRFSLQAALKNIVFSDWIAGMDQPTQVNADLQVVGSGSNPRNAEATVELHAENSNYADWSVDTLDVTGAYHRGAVSAKVTAKTPMGRANVEASVDDLNKNQHFKAQTTVSNLDLSKLPGVNIPHSSLNFSAHAEGQYFAWKRMRAVVHVSLDSSRFAEIPIDSMRADVAIASREFHIDSLFAANPNAELAGSGLFSLTGSSDVRLSIQTKEIDLLRRATGADSLSGNVLVSARLQGKIDSLHFDGNLLAGHLLFNQIKADSMTVAASGQWNEHALTAQTDGKMNNFRMAGLAIDTVAFHGEMDHQSVKVQADIQQLDLARLRFDAQYLFGAPPTILLPMIKLETANQFWQGGSDSTRFILGDKNYEIQHFFFDQVNADSTVSRSFADGTLSLTGNEDLTFDLSRLDLSMLSNFLPTNLALTGALTLRARVTGTAQKPIIDLTTRLDNGSYRELTIRRFRAQTRYENDLVSSKLSVVPQNDSLTLEIRLPMQFSLSEGNVNFFKERPIQWFADAADLRIEDLFPQQTLFDELKGTIDLHLESNNALDSIWPRGFVRLNDGRIFHKGLGLELTAIHLSSNLDPTKITIDELSAQRGKGSLLLTGSADLQNSLTNPFKTVTLNLRAHQLFLSTNPQHEIQVQADVMLTGAPPALAANGEVTVLRSSFDTAIFLKKSNRSNIAGDSNVPLLVQALQKAPVESTVVDTTILVTLKKPTPNLLKQLSGSVKLKIPRNTWLRNDNMRIELSGDLDVIKSPQALELFGSIQVLRGQYTFLGRRFVVSEGEVTFQGGEKIDPLLNIHGDYTFRDSRRDKRVLQLIVSGQTTEPMLRFTLDDIAITEGEAASYLLFGKSPDELTSAQASDAATSSLQPGRLATNAAYGLLSAQLAKRIGSVLNLDMMEIQGQDKLNAATFIVGKYLTPDLFMSFEHSFGALEEDRPPQVVTIEYELTKYLFLQLISGDTKTTGADLVFKWMK
jgi:translocation and assembly module TamB